MLEADRKFRDRYCPSSAFFLSSCCYGTRFMPFPRRRRWPPSLSCSSSRTSGAAWDYGPAQRAFRNSLVLAPRRRRRATRLARRRLVRHAAPALRRRSSDRPAAGTPVALPGLVVGMGLTWFYLEVPLPIYGTPAHPVARVRHAARALRGAHLGCRPQPSFIGARGGRPRLRRQRGGGCWRASSFALLAPSLLASALYVVLRSFREYSASIFLVGPGVEVFSVLVLDMSQSGNINILAA